MRSHYCCPQNIDEWMYKTGKPFPRQIGFVSTLYFIQLQYIVAFAIFKKIIFADLCTQMVSSGIVCLWYCEHFKLVPELNLLSFLRGMHEQFTCKCITGDHSIDMLNPEVPLFVGQTFKWASCNFTNSHGISSHKALQHIFSLVKQPNISKEKKVQCLILWFCFLPSFLFRISYWGAAF